MTGRGIILGALLGGALALSGSYWALFVRPEERSDRAVTLAPETLRLQAMTGHVEVAGLDGRWHPLHPGDLVSIHDRIRTDEDGLAELHAADASTIKLWSATEAQVSELRRELKRLHVGNGVIEAEVPDDPARVFEVELDGEGTTARTRGANFTVGANGHGTAVVGARRGEVILSARGKEVVIRSGQFARVLPGAPPEPPQPLPTSLFLKVDWPKAISSQHRVAVTGETWPGARIKIDSHYVSIDAKGHYRTELDLADGRHHIALHAVDVAGHVLDEKSPEITVDTKTDFSVQRPKWK